MKIVPKSNVKGGVSRYMESHVKWNRAGKMPFPKDSRKERISENGREKIDFCCLFMTVSWDLPHLLELMLPVPLEIQPNFKLVLENLLKRSEAHFCTF